MKRALLGLILCANSIAAGGLQNYSRFVVGDAAAAKRSPSAVRVTYLGVNGYQFEAAGHALLVDPYFTRAALLGIALNRPLMPDNLRIEAGLRHVSASVDAVFITHAHFDHLLDVPQIVRRTGARLFSGATAIRLADAAGSAEKSQQVQPGEIRRI